MQFWHILGSSAVRFLWKKFSQFWKVAWILLDGRGCLIYFSPRWITAGIWRESKGGWGFMRPAADIRQAKWLVGCPSAVITSCLCQRSLQLCEEVLGVQVSLQGELSEHQTWGLCPSITPVGCCRIRHGSLWFLVWMMWGCFRSPMKTLNLSLQTQTPRTLSKVRILLNVLWGIDLTFKEWNPCWSPCFNLSRAGNASLCNCIQWRSWLCILVVVASSLGWGRLCPCCTEVCFWV